MAKVNSLILLIKALSKAEKKAIYQDAKKIGEKTIYMDLFNFISIKGIEDSSKLQEAYCKKHSKVSFHTEVRYLYDFILGTLTKIKINQDKSFGLYWKSLSTRVLIDKNLKEDYYSILKRLIREAEQISDYYSLLRLQRLELDFLSINDYYEISEELLLKKHHKINDTVKIIRQINDQSALYELLLFRLKKDAYGKLNRKNNRYDDLVISEISLIRNMNKKNLQVQTTHQLFQALYLNSTGDYKSALNTYIELDNIFQENPELWNNPPIYYMKVLEGILKSLKDNKAYDQMSYFLERLDSLTHPSVHFRTEVTCIIFIYTVDILINKEEYKLCLKEIDKYQESLLKKKNTLSPFRYIQLSLQLAIVYLLNKKYSTAQKHLAGIINNENYAVFALFRGVQLINIILNYVQKEFDLVTSQIRSMKRKNKMMKSRAAFENIIFYFVNIDLINLNKTQKEKIAIRIKKEFEQLRTNGQDRYLLSIFDFEKWMLTHLVHSG